MNRIPTGNLVDDLNMKESSLLINIQFLRFVAAFLVVLFHAIPLSFPEPDNLFLAIVRSVGFSGVDLFFVISGFVIWHTTSNFTGSQPAWRYLRKRFLRIYLGYLPFFIIAWIIYSVYPTSPSGHSHMVASALLLPIPINQRLIPVSWTLTFELLFYLQFFFLVFAAPVFRVRILISVFVGLLLINLVGVTFFDFYSKDYLANNPFHTRILYSPYTLEFVAGALIAANAHRVKPNSWPAWLILFLLLSTLGSLLNLGTLGWTMQFGIHLFQRVAVFGSAAVAIILAAIALEKNGNQLFPKFSLLFGGASYSTYLAHTLIIFLYPKLFSGLQLAPAVEFSFVIVLVYVYSLPHYLILEKPLYRSAVRTLVG